MAQQTQIHNWCFTLSFGGEGQLSKNDVHEFWNELCEKAHYAVAGFEVAPTTGQRHLQGYVQLERKLRLTQLKKLHNAATVHWEIARGDEESNEAYCTKEGGEILRFGDEPRVINAGKRAKRDYAAALALAKEGDIDNIDPQLLVQYFRTFNLIKDAYKARQQDLTAGTKMMWIYGPTGTGKSRSARQLFADMGEAFYNKLQNKWWDHYTDEKNVLIDDLGLETGQALVNFLKLWLDMYVFKAEYKGGAMDIRPRFIVITSNYHPHEIWGGSKDYDPLMRRLEVVYIGPPSSEYTVPDSDSSATASSGLLAHFSPVPTYTKGLEHVRAAAKKMKLIDLSNSETSSEDDDDDDCGSVDESDDEVEIC